MNNTIKKNLTFWINCYKDNLKTARAMFKAGRWNFCMFMCQQTLEAMLKAAYIHSKRKPPPLIHNLVQLVNLLHIELPDNINETIILANAHYIIARYKEDRFNTKIYNRLNAEKLLDQTLRTIRWFIKNQQLKKL
ncbi:MAG: HEPN domain-containing protein [Candidatus Hydrogenedentota bacterium]